MARGDLARAFFSGEDPPPVRRPARVYRHVIPIASAEMAGKMRSDFEGYLWGHWRIDILNVGLICRAAENRYLAGQFPDAWGFLVEETVQKLPDQAILDLMDMLQLQHCGLNWPLS
jgi:hypothetical protein